MGTDLRLTFTLLHKSDKYDMLPVNIATGIPFDCSRGYLSNTVLSDRELYLGL